MTTEFCNREDFSDKNVFAGGYWRGSLIRVGLRENGTRGGGGWGFPSSPGLKNPAANAEDMGLITGPGRSYMPWGN